MWMARPDVAQGGPAAHHRGDAGTRAMPEAIAAVTCKSMSSEGRLHLLAKVGRSISVPDALMK